ncbi:MAG: TrkH family potassium uptake protein [Deltaproteobacteria bacterium]|nr:TrkH family potassium uptake protein [Deltaproteobacteria bacterium]
MNFQIILRFTGILIFFLGVAMAPPLGVSFLLKDDCTQSLLLSMAITCSLGILLFVFTRNQKEKHLNHRDGVAIVTLGWMMAGLVGALPYLFSGTLPDFTNACFESISGFTTTGASVVTDIESLPEGILLWRSLTQWLGGMGIIVLSIAILPFLGIGGMQLYKAEIPSPVVDKLKPRISETARILWKIYLLITLLQVLLLLAGGMNLFDSVCHAFCTMPTGGFSTKNTSLAHYNSAYFDFVIVIFMLLAGINFSLHYRLLKGDLKIFGKDAECRVFLILVGAFILLVTLDIYGDLYSSLFQAFRYAAFQVSSIITTTGFVSADYEKWPHFSQLILLICMFLGAMAGSTGGGIKTVRLILMVKHSYQQIFRIIHPHAVTTVKLGGQAVSEDVLSSVWGFFFLYMGLFVIAFLAMASMGLDYISAISSVAATIGNIGPGLGIVGPIRNYLEIPTAGKWVLNACMLLGRLEIYTVIVLLAPEYWRK